MKSARLQDCLKTTSCNHSNKRALELFQAINNLLKIKLKIVVISHFNLILNANIHFILKRKIGQWHFNN